MSITSERSTFSRLRELLRKGWMEIPDETPFRGTAAPGTYLEHLLGVQSNNIDAPDTGKWEVKFHGGKSLITMFHLDPHPRADEVGEDGMSGLEYLVLNFGTKNEEGIIGLRHTIRRRSPKGFFITSGKENRKIILCHASIPEADRPFWTYDEIINVVPGKMRRLLLVRGETRKEGKENCIVRHVRYLSAQKFTEPKTNVFIKGVAEGLIAIDLDARTKSSTNKKLRNHGVKFRIKETDMPQIYSNMAAFI